MKIKIKQIPKKKIYLIQLKKHNESETDAAEEQVYAAEADAEVAKKQN